MKTQTMKPAIINCFILSVSMLFTTSLQAGTDCEKITGEGNVFFVGELIVGPDPIALGNVVYDFADEQREATVTSFLIEPVKTTEDGSIHLVTDVYHDFPNGDNLTWRLNIVLSLTDVPGEYRLNEHNVLQSGAGIYEAAYGRGTGHGLASFNTGSSQISASLRLCGIED